MLGKFKNDPDLWAMPFSTLLILHKVYSRKKRWERLTWKNISSKIVLALNIIRQIGEVTWGYEHSLVTMANLILPEDQKLPELFGYFYGKCYIESTWLVL